MLVGDEALADTVHHQRRLVVRGVDAGEHLVRQREQRHVLRRPHPDIRLQDYDLKKSTCTARHCPMLEDGFALQASRPAGLTWMSGSWSLLFGVQWWTLWLYLRDMQAQDTMPDKCAAAERGDTGQ